MDDVSQKLNRVKPLIKARKGQVDQEAAILAQIRREKSEVIKMLEQYQNMYMQGVEEINTERQSSARDRLNSLERSVDYAKSQWHKTMVSLKEMESKENAQLAQFKVAERNLKSVEKLEERYHAIQYEVTKSKEQKNQDEIAIRRYYEKRTGND